MPIEAVFAAAVVCVSLLCVVLACAFAHDTAQLRDDYRTWELV
tara:strand:- start:2455 stop:2583 length:129 start_codon:yes stop_codon:yes gene_type:complete